MIKRDNTIDVSNFSNINNILAVFRARNNRIHPLDCVNNKIRACNISDTDIHALKQSHRQGMDAVSIKDKHLHYYHTLLTSQLSDPQAWGMFPVVDSLNLTLDATETEVKRALKFFENNDRKEHSQIRVKHVEIDKDRDRRSKSRYLKKRHVWLDGIPNQKLYISIGLVGGKSKPEEREIRISLNPSRFTGNHLKKLLTAINDTKVFNDFWHLLANANITRLDLAVDFIGVPTPILIFNSPRCTKYDYAKKRDPDDEAKDYLQTQYVGKRSSSHYKAYDKVKKKQEKNQKHVCTLQGPDKLPVYYTRLERVIKVQANGTNRKFKDMVGSPFMFKEIQFFSPTTFRELKERQHDALEKGFLYTLLEDYQIAHGLTEDQLQHTLDTKMQQPKYAVMSHKQLLTALYKDMFHQMNAQLERHKLTFNYDWFESRQKTILKNVLKFMLPKKYRDHP